MRSRSAAFDEAIRAGVQERLVRVWSLDPQFEPIGLFEDVLDGDVVRDRTRPARRTGRLALENVDARYRLEPGSLFAFDRCRIELGLRRADGVEEYVSQITAVTSEPSLEAGMASVFLTDLSAVVDQAQFTEPDSFGRGTRLADYARALLIRAGIPDEDARFDLDDYGTILAADVHHDAEDYLWESVVAASEAHGLRVYFDADGVAVQRRVPVLSDVEPVWIFEPGPNETGRVRSRGLSFARVRNRAYVRGGKTGQVPFVAEARNLNAASPFYNPPPGHPAFPGPAGDRPIIPPPSALIADQEQAMEVARVTLQDHALAEDRISVEAIFHPALDEEDVFLARSKLVPTEGLYVADLITSSLRSLTATISGRKVEALT